MELQKCLNDVGLGFSEEQCESLEALFALIQCDHHLHRILERVKVPLIEGLSKSEHQYLELVAVTQKYLLRPKGLERDDLVDYNNIDRDTFLKHARRIGLLEERIPPRNTYPVVALLAGYEFRTEQRLKWLLDNMENGIINGVKTILVCAGERPLEDNEEAIHHGCSDETEMVKFVMEKHFPHDEFSDVNIIYSNAPKEKGDTRARTDGAAHYAKNFLKKIPAPLYNTLRVLPKAGMTVLVVSNQPYCEYQGMVYQQVFYPTNIITVGAAASIHCTEQDIYDSLARYIYANALRYFVTQKQLAEDQAKDIVHHYIQHLTA